MLFSPILGLVGAAAHLRASGRLLFRDADGSWGGDAGAVLTLEAGKVKAAADKAGSPLDPVDREAFDESLARANAVLAEHVAKRAAKGGGSGKRSG
jgi:hypothetical protein